MIKIENTEVVGLEPAIRGMRNPKNSWDKCDSAYEWHKLPFNKNEKEYVIGPKDLKLATTLANAGTDHGKFLRMIVVYVDITAPLYWWKEFDTYKVGTVANSCSTMHKIQDKVFDIDDFSHEHLDSTFSVPALGNTIYALNWYREKYLETKDKHFWWQMIQLLPSSYNQKRTVMVNYAVLRNIYNARNNHKLDEWHELCEWIKWLPHAKELIIGD